MKTRMYEYLIAYHHKCGLGTTGVTRSKKIESWTDAVEVAKLIERNSGSENVGIMNIVLLRTFKE